MENEPIFLLQLFFYIAISSSSEEDLNLFYFHERTDLLIITIITNLRHR